MTLCRRWDNHTSHAKNNRYPGMIVHSAIRKYGKENFSIRQLSQVKEEHLCEVEKVFIKYYNCRAETGWGYNLTDGGDGMSGRIPGPETRKKMSAALIGNQRGKGRKLTYEEIEHLQSFVRGKKNSRTNRGDVQKRIRKMETCIQKRPRSN